MDEIEPQPDVEERLADLRRRRVEAADVLAETLLDIYLRGRQAKRAGKPWPPYEPLPPPMPDPPKARAPKPPPKRARPGLVRKYRLPVEADLDLIVPLVAAHGLTRDELLSQVNRYFVIQEHEGRFLGVGVLDRHGPVGVVRALVIKPDLRRAGHGSFLALHLLKQAYQDKLLFVYGTGAAPGFFEDLGFKAIDRASVPEMVLSLPGLAGTTQPIFEMKPRADGAKRPRRSRPPTTLTELLSAPERRSRR